MRVSELEKENSQKNKQILELQANLGGLTAFNFDFKDKLIGKFGGGFKPSSSESRKAPETSERVVIRPTPDSNIDQHLSSGPAIAEERREKQKKSKCVKKDKMLLMKNFDQNAIRDQPQKFIK